MDSDLLSVMADISNIEMPKTELIDVKPEVPPDLTEETGSDELMKQTTGTGEFSKNPWTVPTLEDFLFYCCPECPDKYRSSISFTNHAVKNHPKAKEKFGEIYLPDLEFSPDEQNDDINEDFNEDNEDGEEPDDDEDDVKPDLPDLDGIDNDESDEESSNQESRLE